MKNVIFFLISFLSGTLVNAQSLIVFDIDAVSFPVVNAKFYALNEDNDQLLDLSPDDFEIYEDGMKREVLSVSCPEPVPPAAISSVLVMDVSGSMSGGMLNLAQEAGRAWINGLPLGKSECAITCFNSINNLVQDFTKDRNRLLEKIEALSADGGTDYDAGFINPFAGGLLVAKTGKYKKVLVFLTDGYPNFTPNIKAIVDEALKNDITIFCVTLNMKCPQCLYDIAQQTGGNCFENVSTVEEARTVYMKILHYAQGNGPCEIEWKTATKCDISNVALDVTLKTINMNYESSYCLPAGYLAKLQVKPDGLFFANKQPGIKHDTTITITAKNSDFNISDITSSNPDFEIQPSAFSLKKGDSISLTISVTPSDSGYIFTIFEFINDICESKYFSGAGFTGVKPANPTIKLTHPNGAEVFLVGSDSVITWEGIAADEKVMLEYSHDKGKTWQVVADTATGLSHKWNNIPGPVSEQCLGRVKQLDHNDIEDKESKILWQRCLGGYREEEGNDIQATYDGGYIVAGATLSDDGDVSDNNGIYDFWIVKLDAAGNIEWQKCIGSVAEEAATSIQQTTDNGYIVAGTCDYNSAVANGNHGGYDYWVVKLDYTGKIEWQKCYGGSGDDKPVSILQTLDGGFVIAGTTASTDDDVSGAKGETDIWIVKTNYLGDIEWQRCYGGSLQDGVSEMNQTYDNGYIIAGQTYSYDMDVSGKHGECDCWILKINPIGGIEWQKCIGGSDEDVACSIKQTTDGGYIASGFSYSADGDISRNNGSQDMLVFKLDLAGNLSWQKCFGGSSNEIGNSVIQVLNGNFLVAGWTESNDGDISARYGSQDCWIVELNGHGELQWQKCFGGTRWEWINKIGSKNDDYFFIGITRSNDYDVHGRHGEKDIWVAKLEKAPSGEVLQEDISDNVFSIVAPEITSIDIDMGKELVGNTRDSVVKNFITNIGSWDCRIDSIYFRGADYAAFSLISGIPQYTVATGAGHHAEFAFSPKRTGLHEAEIVIISQSETLIQNIQGIGIEPKLAVLCDIIDFGQVYLKEHKDTVKAIIQNTGASSIEITKTEISGPDIDQFEIIGGGGSFTLASGEERELILRFKPEYLGKTSTNLNFYHKETGSPALTQLYGEGIKNESDCDSTGFEYPEFLGVDDIVLVGSAGRVDDFVRITYANQGQAGGIWHEKAVPVGNGFITEFSFRMSSGSNENTDDDSYPGADGLAFVVQNNSNHTLGTNGGGLGYHGIENALAVEFDLFKNDRTQIINFKDPNGNHTTIQKSNGNKLSALHNSDNTVEINKDIIELKSDGTVYYAKIEYNIEPNVMSIYLDDTGALDDPVIVAGGIDLSDIVNLNEDLKAYVGITSATGNAYEIHDLLDWYFCPFPVDITPVESNISRDEIAFNIYPNPVSGSTTIEFNNPEYQYISLNITDIFGREVKKLYSGFQSSGSIRFNWETGRTGDGIYFCRLNLGGESFVKTIVVNR